MMLVDLEISRHPWDAISVDTRAMAFELVAELDPDVERVRAVQSALGEELPWYVRSGAINDPLADEG